MGGRRLLAAPDKFRGTATAAEIGGAIADAAASAGWQCEVLPISDGGEGLLACFGGADRQTVVTGPLGAPVSAAWRLDGTRAVIEMATASGLALTAGANDAIGATTHGTGELIAAAAVAGATLIIVGAGGSATTDGGLGAVHVLRERGIRIGPGGIDVVVATDVTTSFIDAARVFAPQKGADAAAVELLTARLTMLCEQYRNDFGIDVTTIAGTGAAGGLAGGLAAIGARIRPGFQFVADHLGLPARIAAADLVITGEGRLDATTALGKAPGALVRLCEVARTPVAMIVGEIAEGVTPPAPTIALVTRYGRDAALHATLDCVRAAAADLLADVEGSAGC